MSIVTRFAPSPTGYMHIGNARTALFNYLFARHNKGKFLLRIEDTDRERSTQDAIDKIFQSLEWLDFQWDGEAVFQSKNQPRHAAIAQSLLENGKAYYCYCTPEELAQMREQALKEGRSPGYDGRWRDKDPSEAPAGVKPVIRLKAPREGETKVIDLIQGEITVQNAELDDMILLRSDGTPTYMLSVVVDDHDMSITHVIRGSDHLTNSFRQSQLFQALGWEIPIYSHLPLIHGSDGGKLSKRHGALGVDAYQGMGYLPEALCNYLLRLGWSHGDDEIISRAQAIEWFTLKHVQKSPARFDLAKLTNLNAHYLREADNARLLPLIEPYLKSIVKRPLTDQDKDRFLRGMDELKTRAKTLEELAELGSFYIFSCPIPMDDKVLQSLDSNAQALLRDFSPILQETELWSHDSLESLAREFVEQRQIKLGDLAKPLRAALTGRPVSPGIFDVMVTLGKEETLERLKDRI